MSAGRLLGASAVVLIAGSAVAGGGLLVPVAGQRVLAPMNAELRLSCAADEAVIAQCEGGACTPISRVRCAPYGCDAASGTCHASCATSAQCAAGGACNTATGRCVPPADTCRDTFTLRHVDGFETSCAPYACAGGRCRTTCAAATDCAPHHACAHGFCRPLSRCAVTADCTYGTACSAAGYCEPSPLCLSAGGCPSGTGCSPCVGRVSYNTLDGTLSAESCVAYCLSACAGNQDCPRSYYCSGGRCVP